MSFFLRIVKLIHYFSSGCVIFQVQFNDVNQGRCGECGDEVIKHIISTVFRLVTKLYNVIFIVE